MRKKVYLKFEGYLDGNYADGHILGIVTEKDPADEIDDGIHYLEYYIEDE